jgi:hypothetical protein
MSDGPFPIFCRGHSGGRILCEAYRRNGIQMGEVAPDRKDTTSFALSLNPSLRDLVLSAYRYPSLAEGERARLQWRMREVVARFRVRETDGRGPFGWKMGTNIFTMLVFLDAFPAAKCVHLIRDGRDVMLSRLDNRFEFGDPANRLMVFGDDTVDTFLDRPLSTRLVEELRNPLEMQHWVTAVEYGLRGRAFEARYLEVRYEDLCREPEIQGQRIFDFLGMMFRNSARDWLVDTVSRARIGKWNALSASSMALPMAIGHQLLTRLGYC